MQVATMRSFRKLMKFMFYDQVFYALMCYSFLNRYHSSLQYYNTHFLWIKIKSTVMK